MGGRLIIYYMKELFHRPACPTRSFPLPSHTIPLAPPRRPASASVTVKPSAGEDCRRLSSPPSIRPRTVKPTKVLRPSLREGMALERPHSHSPTAPLTKPFQSHLFTTRPPKRCQTTAPTPSRSLSPSQASPQDEHGVKRPALSRVQGCGAPAQGCGVAPPFSPLFHHSHLTSAPREGIALDRPHSRPLAEPLSISGESAGRTRGKAPPLPQWAVATINGASRVQGCGAPAQGVWCDTPPFSPLFTTRTHRLATLIYRVNVS